MTQRPGTRRYAMGIWWSRWYDLNNYDIKKVVDDYESRSIPLDVFVIDMVRHRMNAIVLLPLVLGSWGNTMRGAVRNKKR